MIDNQNYRENVKNNDVLCDLMSQIEKIKN